MRILLVHRDTDNKCFFTISLVNVFLIYLITGFFVHILKPIRGVEKVQLQLRDRCSCTFLATSTMNLWVITVVL